MQVKLVVKELLIEDIGGASPNPRTGAAPKVTVKPTL